MQRPTRLRRSRSSSDRLTWVRSSLSNSNGRYGGRAVQFRESKIANSCEPLKHGPHLVPITSAVVLGRNHQTTSLLRTLVDGFNDVDELLFVLQYPVHLVVVSGAEIAHHVFVAEEEHDGHRVVELVHLVEVGNLVDIAEVDDGKVFDLVGDAWEGVSRITRSR